MDGKTNYKQLEKGGENSFVIGIVKDILINNATVYLTQGGATCSKV